MLGLRRADVPFYLVCAAAAATSVSITGFEILMGLALVAMLIARRPWRLPRIWIPLAAFFFGTLVSLAACGQIREGLPQVRKFLVYLMLFLVVSAFRTVRQVRLLALGWAIGGALSAAWGLKQFVQKYEFTQNAHLNFYDYYVRSRITGFSSHWMTLSGQLMIVLLVVAAVVLFSSGRRWLFWLAAAIPMCAALIEAWTRSMWLGTLCGGVYLIWFWRRWALLAIPVLLAAILLLNPFHLRDRAISSLSPHGDVDSNAHRTELRRIGWRMIKAHPWLGVGPEQVSRQARNYLPPGIKSLTPGEYYGHLENDYIQYAAERGVPTMLALMWMIAWALLDFIRALRRLPARAEERWVLHAGVAVTIAMLIGGLFSWDLNNSLVLAMYLVVLGCGYVAVMQAETREVRK